MITPSAPKNRRNRNSSWWVRTSDRIAQQIISIGGIGTISVVLLVVMVLFANVLPLFRGGSAEVYSEFVLREPSAVANDPMGMDSQNTTTIACGIDEYSEFLWELDSDGRLNVYAIATGNKIATFEPDSETEPATKQVACCAAVAQNDASMLVGYIDGSIRPITLAFTTEFVKEAELNSEELASLNDGILESDRSILRRIPGSLIRKISLAEVRFHATINAFQQRVVCVDWNAPNAKSNFDEAQTWHWCASDGKSVQMGRIENKVNSFSGEWTQDSNIWKNDSVADESTASSDIISMMLTSTSEQVATLESDGDVILWTASTDNRLLQSTRHRSLAGTDSRVTMATPLLGRTSMMIGSESGQIEAVALTATQNGKEFLSIHRFGGEHGSIHQVVSAPESRMVAAVFQDGTASFYYVPTERLVTQIRVSEDNAPLRDGQLFFSANANSIGFINAGRVRFWHARFPFPEASVGSFFGRVWYEGYQEPQHVWQSSTGSVEGEYKFGFMPLLFGTLKSTFYSMLIGAPIALLAAIFGSEFMSRRWRARIKPIIELMATVPSVVLGFIGALVLAPLLREHFMWVLLSIAVVLYMFLFVAHLWLVIPHALAIRFHRLRLPIVFCIIPSGIALARVFSETLEGALFDGDIIGWFSSMNGTGWSGWFCLLLPLVALLIAWVRTKVVASWIYEVASKFDAAKFSVLNVILFVVATLLVFVLSALIAWFFVSIGWDLRGTVIGPYQERNALLVGFVLGFAIIPLIYTLSEDALQSVPQHLRSASLGCGATPWQTTVRVVIPTAASGLFSALMIGLGRAVGETMVVLMAAGNTPVMEVNPFNGYRTLSATLATELPEAARGSTHYHALFLAAFLLFCVTMIANTIAEIVRIRFRKRAYQL